MGEEEGEVDEEGGHAMLPPINSLISSVTFCSLS